MTVVQLPTRARLGGSTIGAAIGVDPYCSPIRLWLELTGRTERQETEAMRWGKALEPAIVGELREQGREITYPAPKDYRDAERPWLVGHPDGFILPDREPPFDARDVQVLEVKASAWGYDEPPAQYVAQVQTYLHLTGLYAGTLATLAGLQLHVAEIERHEHTIATMLGLADAFMEYVWKDEQPPPLGHPDDRHALLAAHPEHESGKVRRESREIRDARRELVALLAAEKARHERIEHLRAVLTAHMGEAETLIDAHDSPVATWRNVTSHRLDTTRLRRDHPALASEYSTESTTRRLDLK